MKTTITGGAGFIGSHLVEHLLAAGDEVMVLDDLSTGRLENLQNVIGHRNFHFLEGNVLDRTIVDKAVKGSDRVFHLAAADLLAEHPLESLRTNIHGTEVVLDSALVAGASLLLASTNEIYGRTPSEDLSGISGRTLDAGVQGFDQQFAPTYWRDLGLRVAIVQLFNTVGPRQAGRYGMVVPRLVSQALAGEPMTVYGDGLQTRCFSYVADIVPAIVGISEQTSAYGNAYDLGGNYEISILALAERIAELLGSDSEIVFVPYDEAYPKGYKDMRRRMPNNGKARELVGFGPRTTIDEIILHVAADHRPRRSPDPHVWKVMMVAR